MAEKRDDLRGRFTTGTIPKQIDFANLIDSMINIVDDGISIDPIKNINISGKVGIGKNPEAKLDVAGDANFAGKVTSRGDIEGVNISASGNIAAATLNTSGDTKILGNLGVGKDANFTGKVIASGDVNAANILATGNITAAALNTSGNTKISGNLGVEKNFDVAGNAVVSGNIIASTLSSSGNTKVSGNLGIGKDPGVAKLDVVGDANFTGKVIASGDVNAANILASGNITASTLNSSGNTKVSGNLGIGKDPGAKLDVAGDANFTGKVIASGDVNAANILASGNITAATLNSSGDTKVSGNLGIGKNPGAKLDVAGDTAVSGNITANGDINSSSNISGKIITSDVVVTNSRLGVATANPNATLDVSGPAFFSGHNANLDSNIKKNDDYFSALKNTGKVLIGWNRAAGNGETDFIANRGNGNQGGFKFYDYSNDGVLKNLFSINSDGSIKATAFIATSRMQHRMYPPLDPNNMYQDITKATFLTGVTSTDWSTNPWNSKKMFAFDNGIDKISIPAGCNTLWLRMLGERWTTVEVFIGQNSIGKWTGGFRSLNSYCPDGTLTDGTLDGNLNQMQEWVPIPLGANTPSENIKIAKIVANTSNNFWLAGLAFTKNPWAHATQSGYVYLRALNGGDAVNWNADNWHYDVLARLDLSANKNSLLRVPVVPNGKDKLLYMVEHNSDWNGCTHNSITVNDKPVEKFMATYDNPFARHWNSKIYCRYIATFIPASFIGSSDRYLNVRINIDGLGASMHFREIGTHDFDIPVEG